MAINIVNKSVDDIYMDTENVNAQASKVKKYLSNINDDLVALKKAYTELANDPKTKGKIKNQANKIVAQCNKYISKNNTVRQTLNNQLTKSAAEYVQALSAFDELGAYADDLGNE